MKANSRSALEKQADFSAQFAKGLAKEALGAPVDLAKKAIHSSVMTKAIPFAPFRAILAGAVGTALIPFKLVVAGAFAAEWAATSVRAKFAPPPAAFASQVGANALAPKK